MNYSKLQSEMIAECKEIFKCVYESEELLNVGFRSGNGYDSSASSDIRTSLEEHVRQLHHGENTNENKIVLEEYQDLNKLSGTDSIWMFLFDFEEKMSMEKIVNIARGTDSNEVEENIAEEKVSTDDALESVGKVLNFIQQNYLSVDSQLFRNLHTK
ncbi:9841_t:CDS:2 [Entrophospora sp. SA101]|nr:9841_t:CDS:2 [Entrophospora sp. SA101]